MSKQILIVSILFLALLVGGGTLLYKHYINQDSSGSSPDKKLSKSHIEKSKAEKKVQATTNPIQDELDNLAKRLIADMHAEQRLNLSMTAQLRAYKDMLVLIQKYAKTVEKNIDLIKEISKNEFQEDVKLQASLFSGKKPVLVANHLEEFRATRVGAILAKMKEKEASNVLDVWAKQKTASISNFYRQVMESYLLNRRRDMNPELFNKLKPEAKIATAEK